MHVCEYWSHAYLSAVFSSNQHNYRQDDEQMQGFRGKIAKHKVVFFG